MNIKEFEQIKNNYQETPIPNDLAHVVKKALDESGVYKPKGSYWLKGFKVALASLVASSAIIIIGVNTSPVFAQTMLKVPLIGSIIEVVTFREYNINEDGYNANIEIPSISGLENKNLENSLNEKYFEENENLYANFQAEMKNLSENGGGFLGVDSGYIVKTDNDRVLSIGRYVVNTVGSSSTVIKYDTIDKNRGVLLTLPSLFKDDSYVAIISENIKAQMLEENRKDKDKYYWVKGIAEEASMEFFDEISTEQNFYINENNKLVISFDKYEVAPGYMGVIEFVIPTEVIANSLVGNGYIN